MLGMGVLLNQLAGDKESIKALQTGIGRTINELSLNSDDRRDGYLCFGLEDGVTLEVWDDGQNCCECRYMHTDDDLEYFVGSDLIGLTILDGPTVRGEWGDSHEMQFLIVSTSKGTFTVETHNKHNGYYGGFSVKARIVEEIHE